MAVVPGSVTVRLSVKGVEQTYGANATGWSRSGKTCVTYGVQLGQWDGKKFTWVKTVDSASKCGYGSFSLPTITSCINTNGFTAMRIWATAKGPGGTDTHQLTHIF